MRGTAHVVGLWLVVAVNAVADPPPNDNCVAPTAISGVGDFAFNSIDATTGPQPAYNCFGSDSSEADVWFCWTPPHSGEFVIDTCGGTTIDSTIEVYDRCQCTPTDLLAGRAACGENECGYQSRVSLLIDEGQQFLIRLGTDAERHANPRGGSGTFAIRRSEPAVPTCSQPGENCQPRDDWNALASDGVDWIVADNFTPSAPGFLTSLCWWGVYFDGESDCAATAADSFVIRYYLDEDGAPGTLLAGPFLQKDGSLFFAGRTPVGRRLMDSAHEFEFVASHPQVEVNAGECYWIEITNELPQPCTWLWSVGRGGDGRSFQDGWRTGSADGFDPTDALTFDPAYCLNMPREIAAVCGPPPPLNDECANSSPVFEGETFFDTSAATSNIFTDYCYRYNQRCCDVQVGDAEVHADLWFDYQARCGGEVSISLCDALYDTRVAVYDLGYCPQYESDYESLACNDDACPSEWTFAAADADSIERLARWGGAAGTTPPDDSNCFVSHPEPTCDDLTCAGQVCTVAPTCCSIAGWTSFCPGTAREVCVEPPPMPGPQSEVTFPVTAGQAYKIRVGGFLGASGPGVLSLSFGGVAPTNADLSDYAALVNCFTGPCASGLCPPLAVDEACCAARDLDHDGDVDLSDFEAVRRVWSGPR